MKIKGIKNSTMKLAKLGLAAGLLTTPVIMSACTSSGDYDLYVFGAKNEIGNSDKSDSLVSKVLKDFYESVKNNPIVDEDGKSYSDVKIRWANVGGSADYGSALTNAFIGKNKPSVWNVHLATNINDAANKPRSMNIKDGLKFDAEVLQKVVGENFNGLPAYTEAHGMIVNFKMLEKLNINLKYESDMGSETEWDYTTAPTPTNPAYVNVNNMNLWKTEKLMEYADSKKSEFPGLENVMAYPLKKEDSWQFFIHTTQGVWGNTGMTAASLSTAIASKTAKIENEANSALKTTLDMYVKYSGGGAKVTNESYSYDSARGLMNTKKAIFYENGTWSVDKMQDVISELMFLPNGGIQGNPTFAKGTLPIGDSQYWMFNKDMSKKQKAITERLFSFLYKPVADQFTAIEKFNVMSPFPYNYDAAKPYVENSLISSAYKYRQNNTYQDWIKGGFSINFNDRNNLLVQPMLNYVKDSAVGDTTKWNTLIAAMENVLNNNSTPQTRFAKPDIRKLV